MTTTTQHSTTTASVHTLATTMVTAKPTNFCSLPRLWTAATATALVTATTTVAAFQTTPTLPLYRSRSRTINDRQRQHVPSSSSRCFAVTDPDTLLRDSARLQSFDLDALEKAYMSSADMLDAGPPLADLDEQVSIESSSWTQPKARTDGNNQNKKKKKSVRSRSSTMPGFAQKSAREVAHEHGLKLMERQSGKRVVETASQKKKRQRRQGEQMYKTSPSVPDSLVNFANEIHLEDRITPREEKELGAKTQEAIRILNLKQQLEERLAREPTDEEWCAEAGKINMEAVRQALEDGLEAKNRLVTANLRMVQGVVNIYIRNGLGAQYNAGDMMQEGIMALIRAAEKFEPQRGFRFSTYAMYWIRSAVKRSQILQSRVIPVPQRLYENHKRLQRVEKELKESLGRQPTKKEMGEVVGMSENQVERCMKAMEQRCYSLDQGIVNKLKPNNGDREVHSMYELLESTEDGEYKKLKRLFVREDLIETLNRHLDPQAARLLLLRYGLIDDRTLPDGLAGPLTIAQVSELVGLKPDKVRRMINNSLKELKVLIGNEWEDFERELE